MWSVDRTRVWRWRVWPTWVLVAIDHFSRRVVACCSLEGPNAAWVVEALEETLRRHGSLRHLISDQEGVFTGEAFATLLRDWDIKHRFGAVGKHGSIAVTERVIRTLKYEWLRRVPVIKGLDHLGVLLADFVCYYNARRPRSTLKGAVPELIHAGQQWSPPSRTDSLLAGPHRARHRRARACQPRPLRYHRAAIAVSCWQYSVSFSVVVAPITTAQCGSMPM